MNLIVWHEFFSLHSGLQFATYGNLLLQHEEVLFQRIQAKPDGIYVWSDSFCLLLPFMLLFGVYWLWCICYACEEYAVYLCSLWTCVSECVGVFDNKDHGWQSLACIALLVLLYECHALECVVYIICATEDLSCNPFER